METKPCAIVDRWRASYKIKHLQRKHHPAGVSAGSGVAERDLARRAGRARTTWRSATIPADACAATRDGRRAAVAAIGLIAGSARPARAVGVRAAAGGAAGAPCAGREGRTSATRTAGIGRHRRDRLGAAGHAAPRGQVVKQGLAACNGHRGLAVAAAAAATATIAGGIGGACPAGAARPPALDDHIAAPGRRGFGAAAAGVAVGHRGEWWRAAAQQHLLDGHISTPTDCWSRCGRA